MAIMNYSRDTIIDMIDSLQEGLLLDNEEEGEKWIENHISSTPIEEKSDEDLFADLSGLVGALLEDDYQEGITYCLETVGLTKEDLVELGVEGL